MCLPRPNPFTAALGGMGQGAPLPLPTPVACCVDAANGVCGTAAAAGATCEVAATPDTRCPGIDLGGLGAAAGGFASLLGNLSTGCCTPAGQCGVDGSIFGRGCVENGEARAMLGQLPAIGALIPVPPSLACDRPLVDDAGVDDAGM